MNFEFKAGTLATAPAQKCDALLLLVPSAFKPGADRLSAVRGNSGALLNRADTISSNQEVRDVQLHADKSRAEDIDMIKGEREWRPDFENVAMTACGTDQHAVVSHAVHNVGCEHTISTSISTAITAWMD